MIKVIHNEILCLMNFTSTDPCRNNISGIYFDNINGKLQAVATDGYSLVVKIIEDENRYSDLAGKICLFRKIGKTIAGMSKCIVHIIEDKFPDYQQVFIDEKKYNSSFGFNINIIKKLRKLSKNGCLVGQLCVEGQRGNILTPELTLDPIKFRIDENSTAIVMPIRC